MRLAHVMFFVRDLDRMRRFYTEVMGLVPLDGGGDGFCRLGAGGAAVALHAVPPHIEAQRTLPEPAPPREDAVAKVAFHTDDVAAERARLEAAGVRMQRIFSWDGQSFCDGIDPEGNIFQITTR